MHVQFMHVFLGDESGLELCDTSIIIFKIMQVSVGCQSLLGWIMVQTP